MLQPLENGGLTAPRRATGLAGAQRVSPVSRVARRPRRSARSGKIAKAVERAQRASAGERIDPGFTPATPRTLAPNTGGAPAQVSRAEVAPPDLGQQLSRRVAAGAINPDQAEKTAHDRELLERTYGPDWRVKVFGDRGYVQRTRQALAENPDDPQTRALYEQLMKQRNAALERVPMGRPRKRRRPSPAGDGY